MYESHKIACTCQGPMGPRDITSILLSNQQLHLELLFIPFWSNGSMLGTNTD
jgi:hypothetical protein